MKVAVVTGASRGIGRSIADNLASEGLKVVYADIQAPEIKVTETSDEKRENISVKKWSELEESGEVAFIPCDISNAENRRFLLDETIKKFGHVDILINNAGVAPKERLDILETTEESFKRLMGINLEGTFFMCQLFANQMIKQKNSGCKIVNISSISAYTSSTNRGEYCISKAGVSMTTMLFADKLAEFGIGVYEIRPGIIQTEMTAGVKEKYDKLIQEGLTPIKRQGLPQDISDVVLAVVRGGFEFCTGQVFNVDGGFHLRRL